MLNGGKRYSSVRDAENTPERSGEGKIQTDGDVLIKNDEEIDTTSPFGVRLLTQDQDVFLYNAWDNVEPDEEYNKYAELRLEFHRENPVPEDKKEYYNENPSKFWNDFYSSNQNRFFKDRYWLYIEFPELFSWTKHYTIPKDVKANAKKENTDGDGDEMVEQRNSEVSPEITCKTEAKPETDIEQKQDTNEDVDGTVNIMELGCGAGNTVFPLLQSISDSRMRIFACDYSKTAVDVVKDNPLYNDGRCQAFVWDITSDSLPTQATPGSMDYILCIFVLSAVHPSTWKQAVDNLCSLLKPGGTLLFRDYGRNDMVQLRFKGNRLLDENFYIRGDGTRVYFFTNQELSDLFSEKFEIVQNGIDRRLIVNRHRRIKMHRVWLQAKFIKKK